MTGVTHPLRALGHEAEAYASRGIKVFPLWWTIPTATGRVCACSDGPNCGSPGKHPRTGTGGLHKATSDPRQVEAWWAYWPAANIGVPAGANGVAIIDVDPDKGGDDTLGTLCTWALGKGVDLMATYTVRTGSGGLHLYYREPAGGITSNTNSFGAPGVDIRSRGGYVVAPPSRHVSGEHYSVLRNDFGLAPWPAILTPLLERPAPATEARDVPRPAVKGGTAWARAGLQRECEALRAMTQSGTGRGDALNVAAYKVGRRVGAGLLDETEAYQALVAAASTWHGHTAKRIDTTVRNGLAAGAQRPHAGPTPRGQ